MNRSLLPSLVLSMSALALTGCGIQPSATQQAAPVTLSGSALHGVVHGGQQPVSGATIQLYTTGTTGYGSSATYAAGTSLLGTNVVTTDQNGSFSITNDYTCPSSDANVYIVATGGNPGLGPGGSNPNLALMTALGPCGNLTSNTYVSINELTTVGSVWSLSGFMTGIANIGTTWNGLNRIGLINAFTTVNNLVNTGYGTVATPGQNGVPANAVLPAQKLNLLADIIAACVNSSGGTAGDNSACGKLFTGTTVNGVVPADTITAALAIAHNPTNQVNALSALPLPSSPFQPVPDSVTDFALSISYSGGGISAPSAIAVDNYGNMYVANSGNNTVTELSSNGTPANATGYPSGGTSPSAVAVDTNGNVWVANSGTNSVVKIGYGGYIFGTMATGTNPVSLSPGWMGDMWVLNSSGTSSSLTQFTSSSTINTYPVTGTPTAIAINPQ